MNKSTIKVVATISLIYFIIFSLFQVLLIQLYRSGDNQSPNMPTTNYIDGESSNYINDIYNDNLSAVVTVVNLKKLSIEDFFGFRGNENNSNQSGEIEQGSGSGFIYKYKEGEYYILTNNHVVDGSDELEVIIKLKEDQEPINIDAELVATDAKSDIAIIKIKTEKKLSVVTTGDSDGLYTGEQVVALGSPYGVEFQGTVTSGIVSAPKRIFSDEDNGIEYIQTDAAINSGNSGGPLFNSRGEVIGMNTLKIADGTTDNIAFAIPINYIMKLVSDLESGKKA